MLENSMLYPRNSRSRRAVSLDGMWKIKFDPESKGRAAGWQEGLEDADLIPVPASFADFYTDKDIREYTGDFWYETDVFVPEEWKGNKIFIRFGCATHRAVVYLNGVEITSHEGGFLPFLADISDTARFNESNRLSVLVNNELTVTNIPCGETRVLKNGKKMSKPYFDFYNYSGLQRPVKLVMVPEEYVFDFTVDHKISGSDAEVSYKAVTTGEHPVEVRVLDEDGREAAVSSGREGKLLIKNARLWEVLDSYLYTFVVRILDGDRIIDEYTEEIGIRTVEVVHDSILINHRPVYLKGFGKHEDSDIVGRGFNIGMMKRDFECMKWIGANSFRTSHYPYSEEIYQMADREGFLVIDEVAAVGMFESLMNFMEASTGKKTAFFEKETTPQLLENHLKAIEEMITRDKNHACVIAWSLLNEPETINKAAVPYFEKVFEKAHELDVQKRPRTFALVMNSVPGSCTCYQFADIISLNRYYGWYMMGGYEISDAEEAFRREMDEWKALDLDRPFLFTEYGADTSAMEHKLPSVMWSQEYQKEYLEMCHRVFDSYSFIKGEQVWNFADFQTTEGIMRVNGNKKGIFTRQRQPKDAAYYFKERWERLPLDYKK